MSTSARSMKLETFFVCSSAATKEVAILGLVAVAARQRVRVAALSLADPGFVLAARIPVSLSEGVAGAVAPVVVVAVVVGSRISIPALEELPLAASREKALLGCPFGLFRTFGSELCWRCGGKAVVVGGRAR